jgi:alpha-L-arabinofuranosidase
VRRDVSALLSNDASDGSETGCRSLERRKMNYTLPLNAKLITAFRAFVPALAFISIFSGASAEEVRYRIHNRTVSTIDSRLFGSFMERPSWGGEIGVEGALMPGTNKLQPAVVNLLREMKLSIVRFPGGTDADFLDWRDMISNVPGRGAARPISTGHTREKVTNNFGYDEFLRLGADLSWDTLLVVNFRDGLLRCKSLEEAVQEAAGLVAYCNAPVGAKLPPGMPDWPAVRKQNGHPKPYKVKYWQIGNETWMFQKILRTLVPTDPDRYYADCLLAYVRAMLAVDPSIEFIVDGTAGGQLARAEMPDKIRHLVFHKYQPWNIREVQRDGQQVPVETLSAADVWYAWVATPDFNKQGLAIMRDKLLRPARQQNFKVAVTEWNWNGWWDHIPGLLNSCLARGVGAAGFLHALMRSSDVIDIGCQSMLVGVKWDIHAIRADASGQSPPRYMPSGQLMALYAAHHGPRLLAVDATGVPTYAQPFKMGGIRPQAAVAYLDTLATANDRTLFLHVINRHFEQDLTMKIDTVGFGSLGNKAHRYSLVGRLDAGPDEPAQISRITHTELPCRATDLIIQVPARSVSCIEIPLSPTDASVSDASAAERLKMTKTLYDQGLIMCGEQKSGRLLLMDPKTDWSNEKAILWQWSAAQSADIKPNHKRWFSLLTECKCVLKGTHVITSASGGAIAMIRMEDKKVVFYAQPGGNTHSVEILPDGNLASASSDGFLKVFCTDPAVSKLPDNAKFSTLKLNGAHGIVWDKKLQRLWAVGNFELVRCKYDGNRVEPTLVIEASFKLPYPGGHDLFPVPGTRKLFVTGLKVWTFDTEKETFSVFDQCGLIKSVTQKDANGPVFFMQPMESWWSDSIRSPDGITKKTLLGAHFYKIRWWVPNVFSYGE